MRDELSNCTSIAKTETWLQHNPSGFFFQDRWHLTFCNLPDDSLCIECLRGRHFIIIGDSTCGQWFKYMSDYFNCTKVTKGFTKKGCINRTLNFTASFIPHRALPLFAGNEWKSSRYDRKSISALLDDVLDEKLIIVIHMFSHIKHDRSEIFQERMNAISSSVRRLLGRNENVMILVKGPHTFNNILAYKYYLYRVIIQETFKDVSDKVIFMEQGDMTIAKNNKDIHPGIGIVREAVRQMIGYIC